VGAQCQPISNGNGKVRYNKGFTISIVKSLWGRSLIPYLPNYHYLVDGHVCLLGKQNPIVFLIKKNQFLAFKLQIF
jgi:hypothetical protein